MNEWLFSPSCPLDYIMAADLVIPQQRTWYIVETRMFIDYNFRFWLCWSNVLD